MGTAKAVGCGCMETGGIMIDTASDPGSWATALAPTRPSLKLMSIETLHEPRAVERVQMAWGFKTMAEARDAIGRELLRRTTTNGDG